MSAPVPNLVLRLGQVTITGPDRIAVQRLADALPQALQLALIGAQTGQRAGGQGPADQAAAAIVAAIAADLDRRGVPGFEGGG